MNDPSTPTTHDGGLRTSVTRAWQAIVAMWRLPRAFWVVNFTYAFDGFTYFGVVILLTPYLTNVLHVPDAWATFIVSCFAAAVTLFMFGFGSYSERFGVRRALFASIVILAIGRVVLGISSWPGGFVVPILLVIAALFVQAAGEGVIQTANYSGVKQYSDKATSAMGFGFNYALFNLAIVAVGFVSPWLRVGVDKAHAARAGGGRGGDAWFDWLAAHTRSGIEAVFWACAVVTALSLCCAALLTRRAEARKLRPEDEQRIARQRDAARDQGRWARFKSGPFGNARFTFFVFILLPARTLFAYQIHIMTLYILRAYPQAVADRAEWFADVVNPLVVSLSIPIFTALTRHANMLRLMLVGTLVTALPTFLLCLGERWELLLAYMVIFSLGEALWQPRFYQFAAELAPEGKMGEYMAAALVPWLLAKWVTGWYSGWMMSIYCPAHGPRHPAIMWAIYGAFALVSPVGLWLARNWLRAGMHAPQAERATDGP